VQDTINSTESIFRIIDLTLLHGNRKIHAGYHSFAEESKGLHFSPSSLFFCFAQMKITEILVQSKLVWFKQTM